MLVASFFATVLRSAWGDAPSGPGPGAGDCKVTAIDYAGVPLAASSHVSLSRTLPSNLARQVDGSIDRDALSFRLLCPKGRAPRYLRIASFRPSGAPLDAVEASLERRECPPDIGSAVALCLETRAIRATVDVIDRSYEKSKGRSVLAEVGGHLTLSDGARELSSLAVGGPRDTAVGTIDRLRAELRFHVVRGSKGGQPPIGGDDEGARTVVQNEVRTASMLWGQCGVHFEDEKETFVEVVDPPPRHLLAVGCDMGLPASGGDVAISVEGKTLRVVTRPGESPVSVAHRVARAAEREGFRATLSPNSRIGPGALRTADVLFRRADGTLADAEPSAGRGVSRDATLGACIGKVDFDDGLDHFDDLDAVAGTLEERTLIKAYADDDPATIDVFIVPKFSESGRIGESFIDTDGSGIKNVVIVDRVGIRAGARSYALAHELGHVLLDMPGHPDDFGIDRPWMLMDADSTDGSVYGPRRLSLEDCERAVRQSGPGSPTRLLVPWPL